MPPSKSNIEQAAYAREYMDRALASEKGIAYRLPTRYQAEIIRWACYGARKLDRALSKERLAPEDPDYGRSPYDKLRISLKSLSEDENGPTELRLTPHSLPPFGDLEAIEL